MTLRSRNLLISIIFLLLSACLGVLVFLILRIDFNSTNLNLAIINGRAHYIHLSWKLSSQTPYINLVSPAISIVFAWAAALVFLRYFRKITSPQLFFLVLFWVSMGVEIMRALNLFCITQDAADYYRMIFVRIAMIGRLFGIMSLFAASLYMVGFKLKQQEIILIVITFISIAMANFIPIDGTQVGQELMFLPSTGYSLDTFRLIVGALTILNFLKYAFTSKEKSNYFLAIAVIFLLFGLELQFIATDWIIMTLSWIFLTAGTGWMTRRFINNYMWY